MATVIALFESVLKNRRNDIALRRKQYGIWEEVSWGALADRVASFMAVLHANGVGARSRVAILADNGPDWVAAELACFYAGAVVVACYPDLTDTDLERVVAQTSPSLVFVGDAESESRVRPLVTGSPAVIPFGSVSRVQKAGERSDGAGMRPTTSDDTALITTTAGASGPCTLVQFTHANLIAAAEALKARLAMSADDETVSVLPLGHPVEQAISVLMPMLAGSRANFAESARTLAVDLAEVEPTVLLAIPRLWQRLYLDLRMAIENTGGWRHRLIQALIASDEDGAKRGSGVRRLLVERPLRRRLGLRRTRLAVSVGARLPAWIKNGWNSLGIDLLEAYGGVEMGGVVALGTPGKPLVALNGLELRADDGRVAVRGMQVPMKPGIRGAWLDTGDIGIVAGTALQIVGRSQVGARVVDCAAAESAVETSPFIRHAVVAPSEGELAAVICLEPVALRDWANKRKIKFTDFASLIKTEEVIRLVEAVVSQANKRLEAGKRVSRYAVYENQLTVERSELTPILTLRYRAIYDWIDSGCRFTPVA
jgi:long-chain acyl-CoA synthetase